MMLERTLFLCSQRRALLLTLLLITSLLILATPASALRDGESVYVNLRWEGSDDDGPYTHPIYSGNVLVRSGTELMLGVYRQTTVDGYRGISTQISGSTYLDLSGNTVSVRWYGQSQAGRLVADVTRDEGVEEVITGLSTRESGLVAGVLTGSAPSFSEYEVTEVGLEFAGYQTGLDGTQTATLSLGASDPADEIPPVITLAGADPQIIECGDPYIELGATAADDVDGDISGDIVIDVSAVNSAAVGSYLVLYNVSDEAGNPAEEQMRTVQVVDTTSPVVIISSPADGTVFAPGAIVDVVYSVVDGCGAQSALQMAVTPGDPVHLPNSNGSQLITVEATDASGNVGTASVTVLIQTQEFGLETMLAGLMEDVEALVELGSLNRGQGSALNSKLKHVLARVREGRFEPAWGQLGAFENQLRAFLDSGVLSEAEGQPLLADAEAASQALRALAAAHGVMLQERMDEPELGPASPNPFNPSTVIQYRMPASGWVELVVYNLAGQRVRTLVGEHKDAGQHQVQWNGRNDQGRSVASGVYIYRLSSGEFSTTNRMILIK